MNTNLQTPGETLDADERTEAGTGESPDMTPGDASYRSAGSAGSASASSSGVHEEPIDRIDRFRLDRILGSGGMGTVYEGWDEKLQRQVALKLLRRTANPSKSEKRFYREAQGLARISHPNVVPVYDVGRWHERVWIAMEYVPGQTLGEWASAAVRSRTELIDMWLAVARGLAAIHDAGLIHRDIKPSNVLVGEDGRVRIVDFGLVKAADTQPDPDEADAPTLEGSGNHLSGSLTDIRGFLGTPGYAAPEQQDGRPVDATSDQFSFCVGLWEVLCGARPPRQERGPNGLVPVPAGVRLPKHVHRALSRGLALETRDRFADMHGLLAALTPRQRPWLAPSATAAATAVLVAGIGIVLMPTPSDNPPASDPCAAAASSIDEVWTRARHEKLSQQIDATVSTRATQLVDEWVGEWSSAAITSCEDVHVRKLHSDQAQDRRAICLARSLDSLEAFMAAIDEGSVTTTHHLIEWLGALRDPGTCLSEAVLRSNYAAVPTQFHDEIALLRQQLVGAGVGTRDYQQQIHVAERVSTRAGEIGDKMLLGEASLALGLLHAKTYDIAAARADLGRTLDIGMAVQDAELTADAWSALFGIETRIAFDLPRASWTLERQAALFDEVEPTPRRRARILQDRAQYLALDSRLEQAESALRQALALYEGAGLSATWERAVALHTLGWVLSSMGRSEAALDAYDEARNIELDSSTHMARQTSPAMDRLNEAIALYGRGEQLEEARKQALSGLELAIAQQGPRGGLVANYHVVLAAICAELGDHDGLRHHSEQADAISLIAHGPTHLSRVDVLSTVGVVAFEDGRFEAAVAAFEQSLAIAQRHTAADSLQVGLAESNLADGLHGLGQTQRAASLAAHALQILQKHPPENNPRITAMLLLLGELELERDDHSAARRYLEQAATRVTDPSDETRRTIDELLARCDD